jgi:DNA-binding beta-propeller fold protein YncE
MNKSMTVLLALAVGLAAGVPLGGRLMSSSEGDETATTVSASAVADAIGAQDVSGPYEVVAGWPKDLSTLPGHEKWTYGGARGIFAESPNRVYLLGGGELPNIPRPQVKRYPDVGPSVQFPIGGVPWRNANQATPPGAGGSGQDPAKGMELWRGNAPPYRELGVDARWEHCLIVVDVQGNIIEEWMQWDKMFKRPHAVYVSPYDPEKHVWVVDDHTHAIYKFTNDGKQLVQTIGTPNVSGADGTHFNRPTFMAWMPDGSFYVSDGYNGTRVAKFDASGTFLMDFGRRGESGKETRPGYMNNVHGVAVDVETRRVFVNDRDNHRVQIFDENGKYLSEWKIAVSPSSLHMVEIGADRTLATFDRNTHKMLKYDLDGRLIYSWGTVGDFPGTVWGVHGLSTDQEGNLYVAEVDAGRFQKFRPRPGANPAYLIGKPVKPVWQ